MSGHDPTDIRSQERAKAETDTRNKLARDTEESDIKWMLGNKRGRRILWRILERSGVFRMSFNTNALQMAFNEGQRNYGNYVLAQIHATAPEMYAVMVAESKPADGGDSNA